MEVLDDNEASLCNFEVLQFLQQERKEMSSQHWRRKHAKSGQVATLILETLSSLEETPAATQTAETVKEFLSRTDGFGLTKSERLMLLNHRPKSELEVHLLIEESEERLKEEQVEKLLEIVREVLGGPEEEAEEEGEADGAGGDAAKNGDDIKEEEAS